MIQATYLAGCALGSFWDMDERRCESCPMGTFSDTDTAEACTPCPHGTYNPSTSAQTAQSCITCAQGNTTSQEGSTSSSQCRDSKEEYI